ncbi:hypothetical protein F5Y17DRAFT_393910 [Xylariaceae sp. FL0594]|nr:hypothetical protein F5Y17DRAFT_393910 [Xylariaceae sp. FL0594]
MAHHVSRPRSWANNPHRIAMVLLATTIGLLTTTILSPSKTAYLVRVDSRVESVSYTTWFSGRGYCTRSSSDNSNDGTVLTTDECHSDTFGYDISAALSFPFPFPSSSSPRTNSSSTSPPGIKTKTVHIPDADIWSPILTRPPLVLSSAIILLCLASLVSHRLILSCSSATTGNIKKPKASQFAVALVSSVAANILSSVALGFELLLETILASGSLAPPNPNGGGVLGMGMMLKDVGSGSGGGGASSYTVTVGPLGYAVKIACVVQLVACAVTFYTCIGGKYRCEGGDADFMEGGDDGIFDFEGEGEGVADDDERCCVRLARDEEIVATELAMPRTSVSDDKYPLR